MVKYSVEWNVLHFMDALKEGFSPKYSLYYIAIGEQDQDEWEVLYIGMTEKQTVSDRLLGDHKKIKSVITDFDDDIWVGLGRVTKRAVTKPELSIIESALISFHKPRLNGILVGRWTNEKITIHNFDVNDYSFAHDLEDEFTLPI